MKFNYEELRNCKNITELAEKLIGKAQKRIALLSLVFEESDGVSRVVEQQARELNENGYDVEILAFRGDMKPPEGVKLKILGIPSNFYLGKVYQLLCPLNVFFLLRQVYYLKSFALLIAHRYPLTLLAYITSRLFSIPYVVWHYDTPELSALSNPLQRIFVRLLEYLEEKSWIVKNAHVVCSMSKSSQEILKKKSGVESLLITDRTVSRFKNMSPDYSIFEEHGISKNDPLILFVGRISPTKNIHKLIEVFDLVRKEIPKAKLIIVGEPTVPSYFKQLREQASENVIFTGFISDEKLLALYKVCKVYATCSLMEGWNLPPDEAQEFGCKVVAFDVPGIRDPFRRGMLIEAGNYEKFVKTLIEMIREEYQR